MIANIVYTVIAFVLALLMTLLGGLEFFLGGALPHLVILMILFVAAFRGGASAIWLAFLTGVIFDLNSSLPFGFHPLVFAVPAYVQGKIGSILLTDNILGPVAVSAIGLVIMNLCALILGAIFTLPVSNQIFSTNNLLELMYTAIFAPVFNGLVKFLETRFERVPGGSIKR